MKNVLFVVTNTEKINSELKTGVYFEEFAVPYLVFEKTGYKIDVASIKGGISPIDENSLSCSNPDEWDETAKYLKNTAKIEDINPENYDILFFSGGHGPMFDIAYNPLIKKLTEKFYNENKVVSAVCHGVCALLGAKDKEGNSILKGKKVTSFTNKEENIAKMTEFMPFSLEDKIKEEGANYIEMSPFKEHVEKDLNLITGQNQNSALKIAETIIEYFS